MKLLSVLLLLLVPSLAFAQESVVKFFAGANAVTFDGEAGRLPSDYELGATGRASLSPHISVVASGFQGLARAYTRGSGGVRVTATDVNDPNFSIGLGMQYQVSTDPEIRPEEWTPDVTIGWKPWAERMPKVIVGAAGTYGLDSKQVSALVALRYQLAAF